MALVTICIPMKKVTGTIMDSIAAFFSSIGNNEAERVRGLCEGFLKDNAGKGGDGRKKFRVRMLSGRHKDCVASYLRHQLLRTNELLAHLEESGEFDAERAHESLRELEMDLRRIKECCAS